MSRKLAVVGGGITGLTCAYRLQQAGHEVVVLEASDRVGGKIRAGVVDGIAVEDGPDAFLPRDEAPMELLRELGLERTRSPAVFGAYIWHRGALRRLSSGSPYGIPRSPLAAWRAGLLTPWGAFRAGLERFHPTPLSGPDVSIGGFARSRFGHEVATNLVDPVLAGVRGGIANDISLAAASKEVDVLARRDRSILRTLRKHEPVPPRFVAPEGGLQRVTEELATRIDDLRISSPVTEVASDRGVVTIAVGDQRQTFDGAVLTIPPFAAASMLNSTAPDVAHDLGKISYSSLAVLTLVYPNGSFEVPPDGSGFLVPSNSDLTISACTWYTSKWPDVTNDGRQVVRCVIGRSGADPHVERDDETLVRLARRDLQTTMGIAIAPLAERVTRWEHGTPQYRVGHLDLVSSIERRLAGLAPIVVAGAGYRGSGIPDCIAQANSAAAELPRLVAVHQR